MTYSIHNSSAVHRHLSATAATTATAAVTGENCSIINRNTISLKRKSLSLLSSESSPKRVTLSSPPSSSSATAIATAEDGPVPVSEKSPCSTTITAAEDDPAYISAAEDGPVYISPITSPSPAFSPFSKRVSEKSPFSTTTGAAAISAAEDDPAYISPVIATAEDDDGPAFISPITSPSPALSPFSKRVSEKSPFSMSTNTTITTTTSTADATAPPPLPFSRFTKTPPSNNNKILRRTLSEPPVFESFSAFCHYMNHSQSSENSKNNPISLKSPLRRSISDPTTVNIILPPAPATATPALPSETEHEEITRSKNS